jgi:hypothetical protein
MHISQIPKNFEITYIGFLFGIAFFWCLSIVGTCWTSIDEIVCHVDYLTPKIAWKLAACIHTPRPLHNGTILTLYYSTLLRGVGLRLLIPSWAQNSWNSFYMNSPPQSVLNVRICSHVSFLTCCFRYLNFENILALVFKKKTQFFLE